MHNLSTNLIEKINNFGSLIREWNNFSLVANSTLDDLWGWHFSEAFSIMELLKKNKHLKFYDFGAGGGVIGYPLFLYGFDVTLIERSNNKLFFLNNIVKYKNIIKIASDYSNSLIIVRGVTSVLKLLDNLKNANQLILFKSFSVKKEIQEALRHYSFNYDLFQRIGNAKGYIVHIYDINIK